MTGVDVEAIRARAEQGWPTSHDLADLLAVIDAVRALHRKGGTVWTRCGHCDYSWPCPTIGALDGPTSTDSDETAGSGVSGRAGIGNDAGDELRGTR